MSSRSRRRGGGMSRFARRMKTAARCSSLGGSRSSAPLRSTSETRRSTSSSRRSSSMMTSALRVELYPRGDRTIVELALSNDRTTSLDAPPGDWLFQTKLKVEANSGDAVFLPTRDVLADGYDEHRPRAAAARPAVPTPPRVRHRPHRLCDLGRGLRRRRRFAAARYIGRDDLAAHCGCAADGRRPCG